MKFQSLHSFEKNLSQAKIYLIISPCSVERKRIAETVLTYLKSKEEVDYSSGEADHIELDEVVDELNTLSLIGGKRIFFLDGLEKYKKGELSSLLRYAENPSPCAYLILGSSSGKQLTDLYLKGKNELLACDLSEEKSWDKKERFKQSLIRKAHLEGKSLHPDAVEHLLEVIGLNLSALEKEIDKAMAFVGERAHIGLSDVHTLCKAEKSSTLWQLAETLVWQEVPPPSDPMMELSTLLPLISQVRSHLEIGLQIALLIEQGSSSRSEISSHFPQIKTQGLEMRIGAARARKSAFFSKTLSLLFDIELMAKNSSSSPSLLFDLLLLKFTYLKRIYGKALTASQPSR